MIELIDQHRSKLEELCRNHRVKTLELFGSAAVDGDRDPNRSDLDFLIDFMPMPPREHSKSYFGLWFALQDLFARNVDLVETPAIRNDYFLKEINNTRRMLYAA